MSIAGATDPTQEVGYHASVQAAGHDLLGYLHLPDQNPTWGFWAKPHSDKEHQTLLVDGVQPDGTIVVTLSAREHYEAVNFGLARTLVNRNKGNSAAYAAGFNAPERIAAPDSILIEMAVTRHLGQPFNPNHAVWLEREHGHRRGAADLIIGEAEIEIRSVRSENNWPRIKAKDVKPDRWILVAMVLGPESHQVRIFGVARIQNIWNDHGVRPPNWGNRAWDAKTGDRAFNPRLLQPCRCVVFGAETVGHRLPGPIAPPKPCAVPACVKNGSCLRLPPPSDWRPRKH